MPHYNRMKSLTGRRFRNIFALTTVILLSVFTFHFSYAQEDSAVAEHPAEEAHAAEGEKAEKFDPGAMIIEHVIDAHDWHIMGEGENSISIPLPIILYSKERGLSAFMSGNFHHGHSTYNGYKLEKGKIVAVNEMEAVNAHEATINETVTVGLYDISLTKNAASLFLTCALILLIFMSVAKAYTRREGQAPKGLQSLIEPLVIFVRDDIARSSIGEKHYKRFLPFLLTVFFFILVNNLMGLVPIFPGGANITGSISITLTLAVIVFILTILNGTRDYFMHIVAMPGVPKWVLIILTPVEILSVFIKPFVLMIRLFANMTAGHIIILSFFSLIFIFAETSAAAGAGVGIFSLAFTIFMGAIELLVAFIQAYVFTLLSAMYFGDALTEHHEDEHGHAILD
ncbi:MAG: F0F1 ATP synthase subunit A [Bacteroidia bacterium]